MKFMKRIFFPFFCLCLFTERETFAQIYTCDKQSVNNIVYQYCPFIESFEKIEEIGVEYKGNLIIYRIVWPDETYPNNSFINRIHRFYRKKKYGSKKDIEYVAIRIENGSSYMVEFEYPKVYRLFFMDIYKHKKIRVKIDPNRCRKIKLKVITWNHLFDPAVECVINEVKVIEVPTFYINGSFKEKYKLKVRSNPSFWVE